MKNPKLTDAEKLERRRAYQREYYRQRRAGERALNYIINVERAEKRRQAGKNPT